MSNVGREVAVQGRRLSDRPIAKAVGFGVFWAWLLARWINDWFLPPGIGAAPGTPFIDPATVAPYSESLAFAVEHLPALANGAWVTVLLTVVSIAFGFVIAVPVSVMRVYGKWTRYVSLVFTELIRGTPLLAQLFVLYFGLGLSEFIRELPGVGVGFIPDQAVWVAIIGFIINSAAYQAEYIRSALISIESGQMTAGRAIGLSKVDTIRHVILPQGLRYAIPAWSNELVYLIKYSSLAAFVTVPELFNQAETIGSETFRVTAIFSLAAVLYLGFVLTATNIMDYVEEKVSIPGLGGGSRQA